MKLGFLQKSGDESIDNIDVIDFGSNGKDLGFFPLVMGTPIVESLNDNPEIISLGNAMVEAEHIKNFIETV